MRYQEYRQPGAPCSIARPYLLARKYNPEIHDNEFIFFNLLS